MVLPRYYSPRELEDRGIRHVKIMTEGHVVPSARVVAQFYRLIVCGCCHVKCNNLYKPMCRAVEEVLEGGEGVVGVHCTHGLNRTGYLVCRYKKELNV